jgi:hypothetical protein
MRAFADKETLLRDICSALPVGGRFAFTIEEGLPLARAEREAMPDSDTVWLTPLPDLLSCLERVGLEIRWEEECTESHRLMAGSLIDAFVAEGRAITAQLGPRALEELLAAHRLWRDWMGEGRVRKFAFVVEKTETWMGA